MKWLNLHPNLQSGNGENGAKEIHFFGEKYQSLLLKKRAQLLVTAKKYSAESIAIVHEMNASHSDSSSNSNREVSDTLQSISPSSTSSSSSPSFDTKNPTPSSTIPSSSWCLWSKYLRRFPDFTPPSHWPWYNSNKDKDLDSTENRANSVYTFDKSPSYLRSPEALTQLKEMLPSVKIVVSIS